MKTNIETGNLVYIDEYPELAKKVWLRRLNLQRMSEVVELPRVLQFPTNPEDAA